MPRNEENVLFANAKLQKAGLHKKNRKKRFECGDLEMHISSYY